MNVRGCIRQIPAETLLNLCRVKGAITPVGLWKKKGAKFVAALAQHLTSGKDNASGAVLADLARVHAMASARGRIALLNAAGERDALARGLARLENDYQRALWVLLNHPPVFDNAEELLFFDHFCQGRQSQHYTIGAALAPDRNPKSAKSFCQDIQAIYRKHDGSGLSCEVEFADRHLENAFQLTVYVEGLANNVTEFVDGAHQRRVPNPSIEAALVYDPATGETTTVARGGRNVHEGLRAAFARHLLKVKPEFDLVQKRSFRLQRLQTKPRLPPEPALGVKDVRVRKLGLVPPGMNSGKMVVEAPSGSPEVSVYDIARNWFREGAAVYRKFNVVEATISIHFERPPGKRRAKTINIELRLPNSSNLKDLPDADRAVAEAHIRKWALQEPAVQQ